MVTPRLAALALAVLGSGCTLITDSFVTNDFSGDPFPIRVDEQTGAVLVGLREAGGPDLVAVLDILSPVTLSDPGSGAPPALTTAQLTLLGMRDDGSGALDLPRAQLSDAELISLHPCAEPSCAIGAPGTERPYDAIVGANVLAGDALRLRLGDDQVFVLADVGGGERDRTYVCDAVFPSPYRGGGTLIIAGTEVPFGGRRVTMQACLGADPTRELQSARGADALLVMSTGIGISILGETAYERYRNVRPGSPPLAALPAASAFLPSGLVQGRRANIDRIVLAAASSSSPRAPCRQMYAHHVMSQIDCPKVLPPGFDCPCDDGDTFCSVPANVGIEPAAGIDVLVVDDANPTLQALRTELRPDQPEVDGILGAQAMQLVEIDVDYPHNRVLMRCTSPDCHARPALAERADRLQVQNCIAAAAP